MARDFYRQLKGEGERERELEEERGEWEDNTIIKAASDKQFKHAGHERNKKSMVCSNICSSAVRLSVHLLCLG